MLTKSPTTPAVTKKKTFQDTQFSLRKAVREGLTKSKPNTEQTTKRQINAFFDSEGKPCEVAAIIKNTVPQDSNLDVESYDTTTDPRYRIVKEVKDSERTYQTFLQSVVMLFYQPCKNGSILDGTTMDDLFGNILEIAEISSQILQAFEMVLRTKFWNEKTAIGVIFHELLLVCVY